MICPLCDTELREVRVVMYTSRREPVRTEGERLALECLHCGAFATSNIIFSHATLLDRIKRVMRLQDDWEHGRGISFTFASAAARIRSALNGDA